MNSETSWEEIVDNLTTENLNLKLALKAAKKEIDLLRAGKASTKIKRNGYAKYKQYTTEEILPYIGSGSRFPIGKIDEINVSVKTSSVRLLTFKESLVCVGCGIIGTHFWAECNHGDFNYHLNLYAKLEDGGEILMTKDHIIPKSKGGADTLNNMQTMCTKCNNKKGNKLPNTNQGEMK